MKAQRRYEAADIRDLSEAEFAELRESGLTRAEWDAMHERRAFGALCAALIHLRCAEAWFCRQETPRGKALREIGDGLSAMVPSYLELPELRVKGTR